MYWFLLVAGAVVMAVYVVAKICHRQLATSDAVFWFLFSFFLISCSVYGFGGFQRQFGERRGLMDLSSIFLCYGGIL